MSKKLSDEAREAIQAFASMAGDCYCESMRLHGIGYKDRMTIRRTAMERIVTRAREIEQQVGR